MITKGIRKKLKTASTRILFTGLSKVLASSFCSSILLIFISINAFAQTEMPLYPGEIPNALPGENKETNKDFIVRNVSKPTLTAFLPDKSVANGAAVIVCPGGGYGVLVIDREGYQVAKAWNKIGVAAFVLKYRLPDEAIMKDKSLGPLQDVQQAIKVVRENASKYDIDTNKIGIMGFSAGGHLSATAGTHYDSTFIANPQKTSLRPDFMVLVYPVISFTDKIGHKGSAANLIGQTPSQEKRSYFSNETQVTKTTPPAFLTHASDDTVVPVSNSIRFYEALVAQNVPAAMHIYSKGEHGYLKEPAFDEWFGRCKLWLQTSGFLPR